MGLADLGVIIWFCWATIYYSSLFLGIVAFVFVTWVIILIVAEWNKYKKQSESAQKNALIAGKEMGLENPNEGDPRLPKYIG